MIVNMTRSVFGLLIPELENEMPVCNAIHIQRVPKYESALPKSITPHTRHAQPMTLKVALNLRTRELPEYRLTALFSEINAHIITAKPIVISIMNRFSVGGLAVNIVVMAGSVKSVGEITPNPINIQKGAKSPVIYAASSLKCKDFIIIPDIIYTGIIAIKEYCVITPNDSTDPIMK